MIAFPFSFSYGAPVSGMSVMSMCPGACVIAKGGCDAMSAAWRVTPQAQNTGTSPAAPAGASPKSGWSISVMPSSVTDAPIATQSRKDRSFRGGFRTIFERSLRRTTVLATLLATGVQGGYYTLAAWLPSYLTTGRNLNLTGTASYLMLFSSGAFAGYIAGSYLTDLLGRKRTFILFAALSAALLLAYTHVPAGANTAVLMLSSPLGFCTSAIFSGFGSFLAELYPTASRGSGLGFSYNVGRGLGALFPAIVGFLAASWGLGGAMVLGALAYGLAVLALLGLPETQGQELT